MAVHRNARDLVDLAAESDQLQIEELVERYGNQWLATARRNSPSPGDAEDAYQRALETLLTSPPTEQNAEGIAAWMHTVIRNEAFQIARSRKREFDGEFDAIMSGVAGDKALPEDSVVDGESYGVSREALKRLRPDQTRCLLLRADGFDYPEICGITGFSYAKVNRLLSEGRKALRVRVGLIESGAECSRMFPVLSMLADGEGAADQQAEAEDHLEHCLACRATLREMRVAPKELAIAMPLAVGGTQSSGLFGRIIDQLAVGWNSVYERIAGPAGAASASGADVLTAKKIAALGAVVAALVGGGVAANHAADDGSEQPRGTRTVAPVAPASSEAAAQTPEREVERPKAKTSSKRSSKREARASVRDSGESASTRGGEVGGDTDYASGDPNDLPPATAPADAAPEVGGLAP
ncbi:MAG: sigma-70 family RNA polymerase sigma factor [Solirubrobacterales bacterium]|nr:sigma-70 family RNA polymerase sigma factor [Solirubrobacterales bacterium]